MPSSYLNDLRIELQADGENASTWGQKLNDALTQIGDALAYGTQDCFATDANATTTVADGAADPARAMYFKVTSTATLTATRTLTIAPNTISRVMFIENATTGSQSITISQGSGSTVTIATGKTAVVYLDGAGATAAVVDAMAKVDPGVTDTLAEVLVAGNATGGTDIAVGTGDDITFADNAKAVFGAGSDLQIYHDGSGSFVDDQGTGGLILRGTNLFLRSSANENYLGAVADGAVTIYHDNSPKLATTATGVDVTGVITTDGMTTSATVNFPDGVGAYFGTGNDLQIYHSGTESIIADAGTGNLNLRGQNQIVLATASGSETYAAFNVNGASQLYYDNSVKFATTSTGIDVTGTVVADGLESSGGLTFTAADGIDISGKESVVVRIDSDDNDAGRVFQVLSGPSASQEILIQASEDAGVSLYYDNAAKIATTSTGIDVTGSTVTDGLTSAVTDGASFAGNFNHTGGSVGRNGIKITSSGTSGTTTLIEAIRNTTNTVFKVDGSGNLILNDQSGNQNFNFNVTGAATFNEQGADADFRVESDNNSSMLVVDAGGDFVDIGGAGNIGGQLNILGDEGIRGRKTSSYKTATMVQPTGWGYSVGTYGVTQLGDQSTQGTVSIGYDPSGNPDGSFSGTGIEMLFAPDIHFYQPNAANNGWKRQLRMEKNTGVVFNENSDADLDFRVESNSNSHMLFVDAGNNRVGINKSAPAYDLDVNGTLQITGIIRRAGSVIFSSTGSLTEIGPGGDGSVSFHKSANMTTGDEMAIFGASEAVFNERSFDQDFRVESDGNTHALFVDASANAVGIGKLPDAAGNYALDVNGAIRFGDGNVVAGICYPNIVTTTRSVGSGSQWYKVYSETTSPSPRTVYLRVTASGDNSSFTADFIVNLAGYNFSHSITLTDYQYYNVAKLQEIKTVNPGGTTTTEIWVRVDAISSSVGTLTVHCSDSALVSSLSAASEPAATTGTAHLYSASWPSNSTRVNTVFSNGAEFADASKVYFRRQDGARSSYINHDTGGMNIQLEDAGDNLDITVPGGNVAFNMQDNYALIVNEGSADADFRVESNNNTNMLFVDAGNDAVIVGSPTHSGKFNSPMQVGANVGLKHYAFNGTAAVDTGISINAGANGMGMLMIATRNTGAGTNTASAIYHLTFRFDGNNAPVSSLINGTNFITFGTSGSNTLTVQNTGGGNVALFMMMAG